MILGEILAHKAVEVAQAKEARPLTEVRRLAEAAPAPPSERSFRRRIASKRTIALIAEVKKASPSKGVIRPDFDPVRLAGEYERAGADAVSVLTDARFFQGSLSHLEAVRRAVTLPLLRKEFIIDPYQVYEARAAGADAILLIVAALAREPLADLLDLAKELGLDALVEVHTEEELDIALDIGADLIGVNNRDLRTFETTLEVTRRLAPRIPDGVALVSESGIHRRADIESLVGYGVDAVLVGEAITREADVAAKVRELLGADEVA